MILYIIFESYDRLDTDEYLKADKRNYHKLAPKIDALGFTQVNLERYPRKKLDLWFTQMSFYQTWKISQKNKFYKKDNHLLEKYRKDNTRSAQ